MGMGSDACPFLFMCGYLARQKGMKYFQLFQSEMPGLSRAVQEWIGELCLNYVY